MYIQRAEIKNIRSIVDFEIEFKEPAGWHVLIGDNGAGKSTIARSMALALVGNSQAQGLRLDWNDWLNKNANTGKIFLSWIIDSNIDSFVVNQDKMKKGASKPNFNKDKLAVSFTFKREEKIEVGNEIYVNDKNELRYGVTHSWKGFFSSGFGPFRRFEGGSAEMEELYKNSSFSDLTPHLSLFSETVALTEPIKWLKILDYESLRDKLESKITIENLKKLINSEDFLPHKSKLEKVSSDGVFFKDGNGETIPVNQMSDGYRSILSLTFELIRQLVRVYGSELVFKNIEKGEMFIDLPGVVLVDEIDAHLHPTWQTRIGQWFLKYFPNLQFIVTTHSPLVCRACEKGSIWRLAAPGSDEKSGEVTGIDRDRLIYGNVLDAYGTEVFGSNISISEKSIEKQEELVKLGKKKMAGVITGKEESELKKLRKTFTTDDPIDL